MRAALALTAFAAAPPVIGAPSGAGATRPAAVAPPAFHDPRTEIAKGKFLIANRSLRDPNFVESVVLLLEYDDTGALGLIINRPTDVALASVLPQVEELHNRPDRVYLGGPVSRDRLLILIGSATPPSGTGKVIDRVHVSSSLDALKTVLTASAPEDTFHAFAGYTGWAPGQLDAEVSRGDWLLAAADSEMVFATEPSEIWFELIRKNSGRWVRSPSPHSSPISRGFAGSLNPQRISLPRKYNEYSARSRNPL